MGVLPSQAQIEKRRSGWHPRRYGNLDVRSIPISTPLEYALSYAECGFAVVPVYAAREGRCSCGKGERCRNPGKHPRTRNGVKDGSTDPKRISNWWKKHPDSNVGIVTGAKSGLVAIDVDPRHSGDESHTRLVQELGPLPDTVEAFTGGGGRHLLFLHPGGRIVSRSGIRGGIDIRADGAFIVAAPSIHASGNQYKWRWDPRDVPHVKLPKTWLHWLKCEGCYRETENQRVREAEDSEDSEETDAITRGQPRLEYVDLSSLSIGDQARIKEIIAETLPKAPGQRYSCVFKLCQRLQGIAALAKADPACLISIVEHWYRRAAPRTSGTHNLEDTIEDFLYAWPRVRYPGGFELTETLRKVVQRPPHPAAVELGYTAPLRVLLVGLCAELQRFWNDRPFYLSTHKAASAVNEFLEKPVTAPSCHRVLQSLVAHHVLEIAKQGNERWATRYFFIWEPGGCEPVNEPPWLSTGTESSS